MAYLTSVYTTSKSMLLKKEIMPFSSNTLLDAHPRRQERLRILRAFYRQQIIFNLYGEYQSGSRRRYNKLDTEAINYRLFGLWGPWEPQQVFCVAALLTRLHREFTEILDHNLREKAISPRVFYDLVTLGDFLQSLRVADDSGWEKVLLRTSSLAPPPTPLGLMNTKEWTGFATATTIIA